MLFGSANPIIKRKFHLDLSIEGLYYGYSTGERIDFTIRAIGYGSDCGYPVVQVINLDKNEVIRTIESDADFNCDPVPYAFDKTWTLSDLGMISPIVIDEVGRYKITASFGETAEKYFIVDDTIKRTIDKTRSLDEVKTFLAYYPNANATVYFVTTCVTDSCETLIRVPSIVEHWYESIKDNKIAFLRIILEEKLDGKPTLIQLSCIIVDFEDANEIHGSNIKDIEISEFLHNESRCPSG